MKIDFGMCLMICFEKNENKLFKNKTYTVNADNLVDEKRTQDL